MIENIDYIICPICQKKMKQITWQHLKNHNLTIKEFKEKFKNSELRCKKTINLRKDILKNSNSLMWYIDKYGEEFGITKYNEFCKNLSISKKGKKRSPEARKSISKNHADVSGKNNPMHGRKHSIEAKIKQGAMHKGKLSLFKGLKLEQIVGNEKAQAIKLKIGKKSKIRIIEQKEKLGELGWPNYNLKACEIFKKFDEQNNTQGRYAVYGDKEFRIPKTSYFIDYINFDLKLIIEVDEKHHFDENGLLKSYDVQRQKEIQDFYPEFTFLRFKEEEMHKILEIKIESFKKVA